jgi:endonuclease/exonuclease/phosphatase family metal-dependent hydrolase
VQGPDRTIDYFFLPKTSTPLGFTIRNTDTLKISDHLPLIAVINLGP